MPVFEGAKQALTFENVLIAIAYSIFSHSSFSVLYTSASKAAEGSSESFIGSGSPSGTSGTTSSMLSLRYCVIIQPIRPPTSIRDQIGPSSRTSATSPVLIRSISAPFGFFRRFTVSLFGPTTYR